MIATHFRYSLFVFAALFAAAVLIGCPPARDNGGDNGEPPDTRVTVPNVVGQSQASAQSAITGAGLTVGDVSEDRSDSVPAGHVISQAPAAGTSVAANSAVSLVVSLGSGDFLPPLDVGIVLDSDNSVSKVISRDGGSLETIDADGVHYLLTIPENALAQPTEITLTPVAVIDGFPFSGGLKAAAHMEPSGQVLFAPAILEATHADHPEPGMAAGFAYHAGGEDFHLRPVEYDGDTARFHILHFSGAGHGSGTRQERQEQGQRLPASQQQATDQAMAETLDDYTADQQRGEERELTDEERAAVFELLTTRFYNHVWMMATEAVHNPDILYCALREYKLWRTDTILHAGKLNFQQQQELVEMGTSAAQVLGQGFFNAVENAYMECVAGLNPAKASEMVAWHQLFMFSGVAMEGGGGALDWMRVEQFMKGCLQFELQFEAAGDAVGVVLDARVATTLHVLLELTHYPDEYQMSQDYVLQGSGIIEYEDLNMECLEGWTAVPGQIDVAAFPVLPVSDVRQCPAMPDWEPLMFRVYIIPTAPPMATVTIRCPDDDESVTPPMAPYWYGLWTLPNHSRLAMIPDPLLGEGFFFNEYEWNVEPGFNPIGWLNLSDIGPETYAETRMELWHTPR